MTEQTTQRARGTVDVTDLMIAFYTATARCQWRTDDTPACHCPATWRGVLTCGCDKLLCDGHAARQRAIDALAVDFIDRRPWVSARCRNCDQVVDLAATRWHRV